MPEEIFEQISGIVQQLNNIHYTSARNGVQESRELAINHGVDPSLIRGESFWQRFDEDPESVFQGGAVQREGQQSGGPVGTNPELQELLTYGDDR